MSLDALHRQVYQLEDKCRSLESLSINQRDQPRARSRCDEVIAVWQTIRPQLLQCTTPERETLERLSDSFTQDVVRLRMMLDE